MFSRPGEAGKAKPDPQPRPSLLEGEGRVMDLRDTCHEAQPQPVSRGRATAVEAVETAQHQLSFGLGNAWTIIRDGEVNVTFGLRQGDGDRRASWRMVHGVLDEIRKNLTEEIAIAQHGAHGIIRKT